jgi:sporulation protein YlmC with PRC-barrel domain
MPEQAEMMEWRGCEVVDQDGDKVGKLDEIYLDRETGTPEWAIVNTGMFGRKSSFVPLKEALREGDMIRVPYQKEQIKDAPNVDPDGEISPEEEQQVYSHYGLDYSQAQSGSGLGEGTSGSGTATPGLSGSDTRTGSDTGTGDASTRETSAAAGDDDAGNGRSSSSSSGGMRLQRVVQEDVRVGGEGEVVERRTVEEERIRPDED